VDGSIRRVLVTVDEATWGPVWPLVRGVGGLGVHVVLCTLGPPLGRSRRAAARALPHVTLHESTWPVESSQEPWADLIRAGAWLRELAARYEVDVVQLNHMALGALPWGRPAVVSSHGCMLSRWQALHGEPAPACWDRYAHEVSRSLRAAQVVVAPTRAMLEALEGLYGPLGTMRVVPYGADAPPPTAPDEPPTVLAAPVTFDPGSWAVLERLSTRIDAPLYAGPEAVRRLSRGPIVVHPGRYDPFGLFALEAGARGCPLVLADIPTLREVWGDAATFVDPDDTDGWIEVTDALLSVDALRREMSARARARAERWSVARMVAGWLESWRLAVTAPGQAEVTRAGGLVSTVAALGLEQP
jgi:glycogen(starch) synthase